MIAYEITHNEFKKISQYVYDQVGIHLADHKINLVRGRLSKRLRHFGFTTFSEYYDYLVADDSGEELIMFTNEISTNVTSFFREPSQWDYLQKEIKNIALQKKEKKLRIWSAACSSGQEPYTIAIFLLTNLKDPQNWDIKILATDISEDILRKAISGIYSLEDVKGLPKNTLVKFFDKVQENNRFGSSTAYRIKQYIKDMILFRKFNLVNSAYSIFKPNTFDMVFCRNVMIYFDKETKHNVVMNLLSTMKQNGHFFIGHSESLVTMNKGDIKLQSPSIYKKVK